MSTTLIEKIHNEINIKGEQEHSLALQTLKTLSKTTSTEVELLSSIGLTATPKIVKEKENKRIKEFSQSFAAAYENTRQHYEYHKILSYEGIMEICNKYRLYFGPTRKFISDVPEKNVKEIDNFIKLYGLTGAQLNKFSVIAPYSMFEHQITFIPFREPVIVYKADYYVYPRPLDIYVVVTAWGTEKNLKEIQKESFN